MLQPLLAQNPAGSLLQSSAQGYGTMSLEETTSLPLPPTLSLKWGGCLTEQWYAVTQLQTAVRHPHNVRAELRLSRQLKAPLHH